MRALPRPRSIQSATLLCGILLSTTVVMADEQEYQRFARRAAPRDAFPVFDSPRLIPANKVKGLADDEWVIGVHIDGEAKAYPVAVMGRHELGNDVCGREPIAVSW